MNDEQEMVWGFHAKFGFTGNLVPTPIDPKLGLVRYGHALEEVEELKRAMMSGDLVAIADSLGDALYFIIGTGVAYSIPLEDVFAEALDEYLATRHKRSPADAEALAEDLFQDAIEIERQRREETAKARKGESAKTEG